jgi:hypothetical protein
VQIVFAAIWGILVFGTIPASGMAAGLVVAGVLLLGRG